MKWLRLLTVTCLTLLALAPTDVAAAPAPQPLSCEIAGIPILSLLSGMSLAKRTVVVEGYQLTLSICAPERESLTAERMLDVATRPARRSSATCRRRSLKICFGTRCTT